MPLALAATLLLLGGCGGSGSDPQPLSKAEFIRKGDAVCKKSESEKGTEIEEFLRKAGLEATETFTTQQQEEFTTTAVIPPIRKEVAELEALGVPEEKDAEKILGGLGEVLDEVEEDPIGSSKSGDPFAGVAKEAGAYGFKTCILYY